MNPLRRAGVVWAVAGVLGIVVSIAYRLEMTAAIEWAVITIAAGILAAIVGVALAWRENAALVRWSNIAGIAWVALYAALAVLQAYDAAAWPTDVVLALIGGVAALLAYRTARREA